MATRKSSRRRTSKPVALEKPKTDADESEAFWSHEAFMEDEDDFSFDENEHSDKGEDIVDSDFDEPEDAPAADAGETAERETRAEERRASRNNRTRKYIDPALKTRRVVTARGASTARRTTTESENLNVDRTSLRKSTKIASALAAKQRERRQLNDEQKRQRKAMRDANKPEVPVLTQAQLLQEAAETEIRNRDSLADLLRLEEEKKRLPPPKTEPAADRVSLRSRNGVQTVSFSSADVDARREMFPQMYSS